MKTVADYMRSIPDFPKPGILFRDITTVLQDPDGFRLAIDELEKQLDGVEFDLIAPAEARGFIFGAPLCDRLHKGMVPVRKEGKLPCETVSETYSLEYGTATLQLHRDAIKPGQRVVIIDDLLATGGTAKTCIDLVEQLGGKVVKVLFLVELDDLHGRKALEPYDVASVLHYEGE